MNKIIYPTSGEIINTITNYISDSIYKYAVLIDGDWGSGKTWFIKNILMPKIDEYIKRSNLNLKYKKNNLFNTEWFRIYKRDFGKTVLLYFS